MPDAVVYIIDDDEAVRTALQSLITARGWHARVFDSASAFLEAGIPLKDSRACLLVDLELDGMNGVELQEHLLAHGHSLPAILMTARPERPVARRAKAVGAATVLGKPFEADDLVHAIHHAMATT